MIPRVDAATICWYSITFIDIGQDTLYFETILDSAWSALIPLIHWDDPIGLANRLSLVTQNTLFQLN